MALATYPTLTPTGFVTFSTPPSPVPDPTGTHLPYAGVANTVALPNTSTPDKAVIQNIGPEPAFVLLNAAAASDTGTAAAGATAVTLASGTDVAVGQAVVGDGIAEGTYVAAIDSTALTLSRPTLAALDGTTLYFIVRVTTETGTVVMPWTPVSIAYAPFISAICTNGASRAIINVTLSDPTLA